MTKEYELIKREEGSFNGNSYGSTAPINSTNSDKVVTAIEVGSSGEELTLSESCSIFETTCNLISVLSGSGMLSLPFAAASMGWFSLAVLCLLCRIFMYSFQLLAAAIERLYRYENSKHNHVHSRTLLAYNIDYITLGKVTFGNRFGDKIVFLVFFTELFMALVSFLINIGLNINVVNPQLAPAKGIIIGTAIAAFLVLSNLKFAAYSSALGLTLTLLILFALIISGIDLGSSVEMEREYSFVNWSGFPVSVGLIAYCFGGHGAFPKMYASMQERHRYGEVLIYTAAVVLGFYALIMCFGYYFFAQFTQAPVTLNIGKDLLLKDTPHGQYLKVIAALGVIFNLQVTCPLITFPMRDVVLKLAATDSSGLIVASDSAFGKAVAVLIVLLAGVLAVCLDEHFAAICGLIGSICTTTSSVIFPICFYHAVFIKTKDLDTSSDSGGGRYLLHAFVLLIALAATCSGIYYDFKSIL